MSSGLFYVGWLRGVGLRSEGVGCRGSDAGRLTEIVRFILGLWDGRRRINGRKL